MGNVDSNLIQNVWWPMIIFGQSLIYWSGWAAGLLFLLTFISCYCVFGQRMADGKSISALRRHHKKIIYMALLAFAVHGGMALLSQHFGLLF